MGTILSEEDKKIVEILYENKKLITPKALKIIKNKNFLDKVLNLSEKIIDENVVSKLEEDEESKHKEVKIERNREKKTAEEYSVDFKIENAEVDHRERKSSDFISYFNSKFFLLQQTMVKRLNPISIANIKKTANTEISLIGMVYDIRTTNNGNRIIELEDPTGKISCMITKNSDKDLLEESNNIILDEVIGVRGTFSKGYLFIKEIVRPDIPVTNEINKLDVPVGCAFISDLHVGSIDFIENLFLKFINWTKSKEAEKLKYIFIAGDLVDGVGVYLGQEKDLSIKSGDKQYEALAELLSKIPEHIKIVVQPGNHDIIGNQEPQQSLKETALSKLPNIIFGTNPCSVILDKKFRILMYHGYSYDNIIEGIQSIRHEGYKRPHLPMIEVLKRRHLSPTYGASLVIPEQTDYLFIKDIPDIFHSGHLHTVSLENYKNVTLINSGTFQGRTKFQEMQGHIPHPGIFAYVDLDTRNSKLINLN